MIRYPTGVRLLVWTASAAFFYTLFIDDSPRSALRGMQGLMLVDVWVLFGCCGEPRTALRGMQGLMLLGSLEGWLLVTQNRPAWYAESYVTGFCCLEGWLLLTQDCPAWYAVSYVTGCLLFRRLLVVNPEPPCVVCRVLCYWVFPVSKYRLIFLSSQPPFCTSFRFYPAILFRFF